MNNTNSLSVLISFFYKEKPQYVSDCLKSLYNQTYKATEIILVKEGELTTEHIDVLDYWKSQFGPDIIRVVDAGEAKGLAACLNVGIFASKCDYIARFDSDDECLPNRFEKQMAFLNTHPEVVLLGAQIEEFDEDMVQSTGVRSVPLSQKEIVAYSKWRSPFNHQTVVYKRDIAIALGGYPVVPVNEDYTFWAKFLANNYQVANLPDVLVKARTGKGLISRRSGVKYLKGEFIMIEHLYKSKLINFPQYLLQYAGRIVVRMLPKQILTFIYAELRKK